MKPISQQLIRNTNLKLLYNAVFREPGISRASIARQTGLSRTAVSALIDELTRNDFLYDSGTGSTPGVGRNPNCLELCRGSHFVLVFEWERDAVRVHLTDISGDSSADISENSSANMSGNVPLHLSLPREPETSYTELCRNFLDMRLPDILPREKILGICFVLPAMIDPETGEVFSTTFSLACDGGEKGLISRLRQTFSDYTVAVLNDTFCAAYAEKIFTDIREDDYAFIRFHHGIGAVLFVHGTPLGDACASHIQFGHMSISPLGPPCPCGNRGCLELMLGEDTLPGRLRRKGPVTYRELGAAGQSGDPDAVQVIRDLAREFTIALSNMISLTKPSLIVLGGNVQYLGELFLTEIRENLRLASFHRMTEHLALRYSRFDSDACHRGTMKYFFDYHYQFIAEEDPAFYVG